MSLREIAAGKVSGLAPVEEPEQQTEFVEETKHGKISKVTEVPSNKGKGVFYWEPQGARSWSKYALSCWGDNGRPTLALDAFK